MRLSASYLQPLMAFGCKLAFASVLLALCGCHQESGTDVLARVGDKEIRLDEFSRQLKIQQDGSPVPVDRQVLLEEMISREVLIQSAQKAGLANDPAVLDAMYNALMTVLKEKKLNPQLEVAKVSEADVQAAYEKQGDKYRVPEKAHLAVLFIATGAGGLGAPLPEAKLRIEKALNMAKGSGPNQGFGPLAVDFSDDQETRYRGGDLGWVERGRYPRRIEPAAIEAGFALTQPGQISEVITGKTGLYLVKLLEKQTASAVPLEKVAPEIQQRLLREKRDQIESDFQRHLREGLRLEVHPERLAAVPNFSSAHEPVPPPLR